MHIIHKQLFIFSIIVLWEDELGKKMSKRKKFLGGAVMKKSGRTLDLSLTVDLKAAVLRLELIFLLLEFRDC